MGHSIDFKRKVQFFNHRLCGGEPLRNAREEFGSKVSYLVARGQNLE